MVDGQKKASISVSFVEQHAFSKSLNGYRPDNPSKITAEKFSSLTVGQSADEVLASLGMPSQVNNVFINESLQITYTYNRNDAKIVLTFIDNKLQGKTQSGLSA